MLKEIVLVSVVNIIVGGAIVIFQNEQAFKVNHISAFRVGQFLLGDIVGYLMGAGVAGSLLLFQDKKVGLRKMEFISHFWEKCCLSLRFQRKLKVWIFCYHRITFSSLLVGLFVNGESRYLQNN